MLLLQNEQISLQFDEENAVIASLCDQRKEYVGEKITVFRIAMRCDDGSAAEIDTSLLKLCHLHAAPERFMAVYELDQIKVTVSAALVRQLEWKIIVEPLDNRTIEWVNFPQLCVPNDLRDRGGSGKILWGFNEGVLVDSLAFRDAHWLSYREPAYPTAGVTPLFPGIVETQFMAYLDELGGLYLGAHDAQDHLKNIDFCAQGEGIFLKMRHYCGCRPGEAYRMPYSMVMAFFTGAWQDAAQIYKDWFESLHKEGFTPIEENAALPEWYGRSPIVITYPVRGRYDTDEMTPNKLYPYMRIMPHVKRLEETLQSPVMVLLMHWEGTAPWAPPYVWPPYGGEDALRTLIDALHARGDVLGVYCSGLGWTQHSRILKSYRREDEFEQKQLRDVMCLSPQQTLPPSAICQAQRSGFDMCPTQRFAADTLRTQIQHMTRAGIDYIQLLDQNHGGTSYFCYSRAHGHPPVPGKWQVDAMKQLLAQATADAGSTLFGCESAAGESYIPQLLFSDNRYQLNYMIGTPVPVYAYIYHRYINNFMGNQVCAQSCFDFRRSPENILERYAYAFSAGDMLTLVLNDDGEISWCWGCEPAFRDVPDQESILAFVRCANAWRQGTGKKYLHSGDMIKPFPVRCDQRCFLTPQAEEIRLDAVHTCAFRSSDGLSGQFLINGHTQETVCHVDLPEGNYRLYTAPEAFTPLSGGTQSFTLPPLSVWMIESSFDS